MSEHLTEDGKFTEKEIDWLHFNCEDYIVDKILENEKDSEQWKIYLNGGLNEMFEIVERLKKYYEGAKRNDYDIDKQLCIIFQKILEGEK